MQYNKAYLDTAKTVRREKFITINASVRKAGLKQPNPTPQRASKKKKKNRGN